ncbi:MAG: BamA/TamA family outer membrane protein [Kofleriaceae bacterium]
MSLDRRLLIAITAFVRVGAADPGDDEPRLEELTGAPPPGEESGRSDVTEDSSIARDVGRGALAVPRVALEVVAAPVRGGLWVFERYQLEERYYQLFFNDARTMGVLPTLALRSGFGVTAGAKLVHQDLFGGRERARLLAATGGRYRELAVASISTGQRLGRFAVELEGGFERRAKEAYYGLGNVDDAAEARYRLQVLRGKGSVDARVARSLFVKTSATIASFEHDISESGPPILDLYPLDLMTGFDGFRHAYGEVELRWDGRGPGDAWDHPATYGHGALLSAFAGRAVGLDETASYTRYGVDLQHYLRLGAGPRVLAVRLYGEGVTGPYEDVPFTELPRLGGKELLRGYPLDRFRDRASALGSVEYSWALSRFVTTSAFVDAGRVVPSFQDLTTSDLRVGYGLGLQLYSKHSFLLRASLATSIDGGVFVDVAFDPSFEPRARLEPP